MTLSSCHLTNPGIPADQLWFRQQQVCIFSCLFLVFLCNLLWKSTKQTNKQTNKPVCTLHFYEFICMVGIEDLLWESPPHHNLFSLVHFVCFIDKTRTVKPKGYSHSWILSFTQETSRRMCVMISRVRQNFRNQATKPDSPAFSTKTSRRALQVQWSSKPEAHPAPEKPEEKKQGLQKKKNPVPLILLDHSFPYCVFKGGVTFSSPKFSILKTFFVCLFVWVNKTRAVKPLKRFHSWILSFRSSPKTVLPLARKSPGEHSNSS